MQRQQNWSGKLSFELRVCGVSVLETGIVGMADDDFKRVNKSQQFIAWHNSKVDPRPVLCATWNSSEKTWVVVKLFIRFGSIKAWEVYWRYHDLPGRWKLIFEVWQVQVFVFPTFQFLFQRKEAVAESRRWHSLETFGQIVPIWGRSCSKRGSGRNRSRMKMKHFDSYTYTYFLW